MHIHTCFTHAGVRAHVTAHSLNRVISIYLSLKFKLLFF